MSDILDAFKNVSADASPITDSGKVFRVGIIGCGGIAASHMKAYLNMPDVQVVAGCDLVAGRARAFMDRFGLTDAKTDYKDHIEMLNDESLALDAVSVCTYNRQHVPCAKAALEKGVNVLLEKPLCVTMDEAWELYDTVKRTGLVLSIGFQPRFDVNMKDLCDVVKSGVLGKIYYVQTGGGRRHGIPVRGNGNSFVRDDTAGVGALGDIGCYSIDMIMNALGHPRPLTVSGFKSDYFGKNPEYYWGRSNKEALAKEFSVDDFGAAFIRLEGGIILDFRISWAMHLDTSGDTIIYGTKGSLRIPSTECWNGTIGGPMVIYHEVAGKQVQTVLPLSNRTDGVRGSLWDQKIRTFLDAIKNGTEAPVPIDQIIYNQAIVSGLVESHELGKEVVLDFSHMDK